MLLCHAVATFLLSSHKAWENIQAQKLLLTKHPSSDTFL